MRINRSSVVKILFLSLAAFLFAIAYCIPYSHDDWDWGLAIGMSQLLNATLNSRYTGNFVVVMLTRSELLKTLVIGLFFLCMPLFSIYIATGKKLRPTQHTFILALLSYALHLGLPADIWSQTNGWVSGFANYSFSTVFLGIFAKLSYDLFAEDKSSDAILKVFLCFLISLGLQLFLENLTVYIALLYLCIFIFHWIYHKKPSACAAALLLGTVLGTLIMFSSDIYPALIKDGQAVEGVRKIIVDTNQGFIALVYQVIYNFIAVILTDLYRNYWVCSFALALILFLLAIKNKASTNKFLFILIQCANIFLIFYFLGQAFDADYLLCNGNTRYMAILKLFTSLLFFFAVSIEIWLFEKNRKRMLFSLVVWFSAPAVMLPLSVVNAVGPRAFYTSTFLIILLVIIMADKLLCQLGKAGIITWLIICSSILLIACLRLGCAYYSIGQTKMERANIIAAAKESQSSEIVLPEYTKLDYRFLWFPTPYEYHRVCYFKEFYGIDMSVNLIFEAKNPTS